MDYINLKKVTLKITKEPLAGDNFSNLFRLFVQNKFRIDIKYFPRIIYSLFLSSIISQFIISERIR